MFRAVVASQGSASGNSIILADLLALYDGGEDAAQLEQLKEGAAVAGCVRLEEWQAFVQGWLDGAVDGADARAKASRLAAFLSRVRANLRPEAQAEQARRRLLRLAAGLFPLLAGQDDQAPFGMRTVDDLLSELGEKGGQRGQTAGCFSPSI